MDNNQGQLTSVNVVSYNCRSLKNSVQVVKDLCKTSDIVLLQEHWLLPQDLHLLSELDDDFLAFGTSPVNTEEGILQGRPYGGVAVLWRQNIGLEVSIESCDEDRILAASVKSGDRQMLLVCVYMPTDCVNHADLFMENLGKIESLSNDLGISNICIMGDFNTRPDGRFAPMLYEFCQDNNLHVSDVELLPNDTFTYFSDAHGTTSWLDHCVCSETMHNNIIDMKVDHGFLSSDHFPLQVSFHWEPLFVNTAENPPMNVKYVNWERATPADLLRYQTYSNTLLSNIFIPDDVLYCNNPNCDNDTHKNAILHLSNQIINTLHAAASASLPNKKRSSPYSVPGWNAVVKEAHQAARDAFLLWRQLGRPRHGAVWNIMRKTRAKFKLLLRQCRRSEAQSRADALAMHLHQGGCKSFWNALRSQNRSKPNLPNTVDGYTGATDIANMWRNYYSSLFNSVNSANHKPSVMHAMESDVSDVTTVTVGEVCDAINDLSNGKASDVQGISAEHLKNAGPQLPVLLSILISSMLRHAYVPPSILNVVLVPVLKKPSCNASNKDSYRPIAIASPLLKVIESVLLTYLDDFLCSPSNQFGFKKKHGTDLCIFALKEIIQYYRQRGSPVFACFLDASKAFDRVNHWTLFKKLMDRGVPMYLVRFLVVWYSTLSFCVRWGHTLSDTFTAMNGLPQGSILSPILFNVYVSDLSTELLRSGVGCYVGDTLVNHLMYADDICLVCPSVKALQRLISICELSGADIDMLFNESKTLCMYFPCRRFRMSMPLPPLMLYGTALKYASSTTYLGYIITPDLSDDAAIRAHVRGFYSRANSLLRRFRYCSAAVKSELFSAYCSPMYCAQIWSNYSVSAISKLRVAYHSAMKLLFSVGRHTSTSWLFVNNRTDMFDARRRKVTYSFVTRLLSSDNDIIRVLVHSDGFCHSPFWRHYVKYL